MIRLLEISLFILSACASLHKDNIVIEKIKDNSPVLTDCVFAMTDIKVNKLPPIDTIVLNSLKRSELFKKGSPSCPTCDFWIYYYGYFDRSEKYFSVIFAKATMTDAGVEELILVHLDKHGNLIDAIPVSESSSPAECTITEITKLKLNELHTSYRTSCAIITDKGNVGERVDSMFTIYSIANTGQINFKTQTSGKIERLD